MAEDPIAVLETRVSDLERKLFGQLDHIVDLPLSITDNLLESHKVISSTLSGREKIASAVKRLNELESVLDPMYEDSVIDSAAKLAFIWSMEQQLEDVLHQLGQVSELEPFLDSEQLCNISNLKKQLSKLATTTTEDMVKSELFDEKLVDLTTKFSEINTTMTAVIATLNNKIQENEFKSRPREVLE